MVKMNSPVKQQTLTTFGDDWFLEKKPIYVLCMLCYVLVYQNVKVSDKQFRGNFATKQSDHFELTFQLKK